MARRRKPKLTPAQVDELARQKVARRAAVEALIERGLSVKRDAAWNIIAVRRMDVFSLLHERRALHDPQFFAARRFEETIAIAGGHERPEQSFDRVDRSTEGAPGQNITTNMIRASECVTFLFRRVGIVNAKLLAALTDGKRENAALLGLWRQTVEDVTGEKRPDVQAAMVRTVCENLALAWQRWDAGERDRRERAA